MQRPRSDSGEYIIPESELEEISGELKEDKDSKNLRAEFSDILERAGKLEKKKRDHDKLVERLEKERAVPEEEQVPAMIKKLEGALAFNPGLTGVEEKTLAKLHERRREIEAIPGVIPRTGTARRRRHRKNRKTAKRRLRTRKH